jgi:CheY-like chemotaxis protein
MRKNNWTGSSSLVLTIARRTISLSKSVGVLHSQNILSDKTGMYFVNETTKVGITAEYTAGTKQTQSPIANSTDQCYEPPTMPGMTNPTFRKTRRECAGPSMIADPKSVVFGSAIVRSMTAPPRVARVPRVLLIDDDPDVAPLVSAALGPFHVRVDSEISGIGAIARLQKEWYDLLVLDLLLGDLHGFEVLGHLKADRRFRATKVLVLTADSRLEALARSFGHGADDFVKKPFAVKELGMRAFRLLDNFGR